MDLRQGRKEQVGRILVPLLALAVLFFGDLDPERPEVTRMAAVAVLMAGWWITEAIPIPATSLLPVALFPLLGILDGRTTASTYFNHLIFLFIGGFLFALAMQRWELHRRIALRILRILGTSPPRIVLGFMTSTWFLSMWISNTASTMMMVPMAMAILVPIREHLDKSAARRFSIALILGTAYSASIGGMATLIGTPPNMSLARILEILFPNAPELSFANWLLLALPTSIVFLLIAWWVLCRIARLGSQTLTLDSEYFQSEHKRMGPMTFEQRAIAGLFVLLVTGWMFRANFDIFGIHILGWSNLLPNPSYADDGTVAIIVALLLFLIPSRQNRGQMLMDWKGASGIKWGIVLLFGGGFALATGFKASGLSEWFGTQLAGLEGLPPILLVLIVCITITFLTELTSNMATTEVVLPVLGSMAVAIETDPLFLMIPATLSASCAFMLPVATAPNAIAFGTGEIRIGDMMRYGFVLNLIGIVLITLSMWLFGEAAFNINPDVLPDWAQGDAAGG
jgi:solute carrier family 13 (sodium-dependent dicarboxylate transporter), member 2/3/5